MFLSSTYLMRELFRIRLSYLEHFRNTAILWKEAFKIFPPWVTDLDLILLVKDQVQNYWDCFTKWGDTLEIGLNTYGFVI